EYHLQQAILAQKASSAGAAVDNNVIPIRPVESVAIDDYESVYPSASKDRGPKYIEFKGSVLFFLNESVYDADSEDEDFLSTHKEISIDDFEQIIERLETNSQHGIIQPDDARQLLQRFDQHLVDEVYGYWLDKRKKLASKFKPIPLVPKVNMDIRKEEKGVINPYIAFRRRAEKVQTRKKQKAEVQHYEKMLRLDLTMKKTQSLAEMIKKREKTKLYAIGLSESVLEQQFLVADKRNALLDSMTARVRPQFQMPEVPAKRRGLENGKVQPVNDISKAKNAASQRKRRPTYRKNRVPSVPSTSTFTDANVVSQDWLQKNAEMWNRLGHPSTSAAADLVGTVAQETEKVIQFDVSSTVDGKFQFKRRKGCQYRAPRSTRSLWDECARAVRAEATAEPPPYADTGQPPTEPTRPSVAVCDQTTFLRTTVPHWTCGNGRREANGEEAVALVQRRIGRCGRVLLDLDFDLPDFLLQ
ncbi:CBR-EPC-1 protein, partial [Aphelenchoides avenae]